ncbi:MAG: efflux RND transporter periplasmic adaptor subunit [Labilithrix sp.]|nr:efflux RND transporter periplasmic adaptor subunit [Labilithrix sp.]
MPHSRALFTVAIVVLLTSPGCRTKDEQKDPAATVKRPDRSLVLSDAGAAYIRVEPARAATTARTRYFAGRVAFDERHVARLGPAAGGRVSSINVVTGDTVRKGDVLLTIYAPDVATAQAQLAQAKTARTLAEHAAERARSLQRDGAGSGAELQQAEAALAQAVSEERRAVAALGAVGGATSPTEYVLRSPIAGKVIERNVAVGAQVSPSSEKALLTVGDLSTVWVVADVFEQDMASVQPGAEASIQLLALRGRSFAGKVTHLSSVVDPLTRAAEARIELANAEGELKPGMSARVLIRGATVGTAEVPMSAVLARRDQFFVFVRQKDGSFAEREVELGDQHGEHATITKGLAAGEDVVTEGAILLDAEMIEGP